MEVFLFVLQNNQMLIEFNGPQAFKRARNSVTKGDFVVVYFERWGLGEVTKIKKIAESKGCANAFTSL